MATKSRTSIEQHLGGGGASAPTTHEDPLIAPGVNRPDWPAPDYANPETLKRAGTHKPGRRPRPPEDEKS